MYHYRLVISYKGTAYFGWQDLGVHAQKPTIQACLHQVLKKICKYQACSIASASRTDAGVHAQGQVAKVTIALAIDSEKLLLGMNSLLPDDIRIVQCEPCAATFNANKDSKSKEYRYYFCTDQIHNPIINDAIAHIPSSEAKPVDIALMQQACQLFIGEHNFYSFAKRDATIASTYRTIFSCEILQAPSLGFGHEVYYLNIVGSGFLKQMVRYIVGALFAVGRGQLSLGDISNALENCYEEKLSAKAKARGLHLMRIDY